MVSATGLEPAWEMPLTFAPTGFQNQRVYLFRHADTKWSGWRDSNSLGHGWKARPTTEQPQFFADRRYKLPIHISDLLSIFDSFIVTPSSPQGFALRYSPLLHLITLFCLTLLARIEHIIALAVRFLAVVISLFLDNSRNNSSDENSLPSGQLSKIASTALLEITVGSSAAHFKFKVAANESVLLKYKLRTCVKCSSCCR